MKRNPQHAAVLVVSAIVFQTLLAARSASQTVWTGPGGTAALPTTGNWSANANWVGGLSPTPGGAGRPLSFSQTAQGASYVATNNNGGNNFLLTALALNNATGNVNTTDVLAGDPLEFVVGGGAQPRLFVNSGNSGFNIGNNIVITDPTTFTQNGTTTNFLSGTLTLNAALTVNGTGTGTISQTGAVAGAGSVAINGTVNGDRIGTPVLPYKRREYVYRRRHTHEWAPFPPRQFGWTTRHFHHGSTRHRYIDDQWHFDIGKSRKRRRVVEQPGVTWFRRADW